MAIGLHCVRLKQETAELYCLPPRHVAARRVEVVEKRRSSRRRRASWFCCRCRPCVFCGLKFKLSALQVCNTAVYILLGISLWLTNRVEHFQKVCTCLRIACIDYRLDVVPL